jgi:hypothetical protein
LIAQAFETLLRFSTTPVGRERFAKAFKLCGPLNSQAEASAVVYWVEMGLASMAMLDYPFASNYGVSLPGTPFFQWLGMECCADVTQSSSSSSQRGR